MPSVGAALRLAAYGVCVILVIAFVAFEVLDVDGSDFASPIRAARTAATTDPPEDLRRAPLHATPASLVAPPPDAHVGTLCVRNHVDDVRSDTSPNPSLHHSSRTTLARGLLADLVRAA